MKRKIYSTLLEWKRTSNGKSAIMLDGARRVGKSYIAEEFARNEYAAYLIVDFATATKKIKRYFEEYLDDLDQFFMYLCAAYHKTLIPGKSVIIFDEVQRFPRAREAIKYLVKDGRFHYIETGSLISIRKNVKNIVIPSEEHHVKMFLRSPSTKANLPRKTSTTGFSTTTSNSTRACWSRTSSRR